MTKKQCAALFLLVAACGGDVDTADDVRRDASTSPMRDAASTPMQPSQPMDSGGPVVTADAGSPDASFQPICGAASPLGCVSGTGERNGVPYVCPDSSWTISATGAGSWSFGCDDATTELTVRLQFPTSDAGTFDMQTIPGDPGALVFAVRSYTDEASATVGGMTEKSSNLIAGKLSGVVGADATLLGTFDANWDVPMPGCNTGYDDSPCIEGSLHLSFRVPQPKSP